MKIEDAIKQTKNFRSYQEKTIVNLTYTYFWLSSLLSGYLKKNGVTTQQYNIMRILRGQHPNPANINILKERLLDKNSDVSRIIDRMVAKGLVERTTCPEDRRAVNVLLTEKGFDLLGKTESAASQIDEKLQSLSSMEFEQLNDLLDKLREESHVG